MQLTALHNYPLPPINTRVYTHELKKSNKQKTTSTNQHKHFNPTTLQTRHSRGLSEKCYEDGEVSVDNVDISNWNKKRHHSVTRG